MQRTDDGRLVALGSPCACEAAADDLRRFLAPAPPEAVAAWLAELSVQCARRASDETEATLLLRVYADRLSAYPADAVRTVLHQWPDRSRFWPMWAELKARLDRVAWPRREMLAAVERGPGDPEAERVQASAETRQRILKEHGFPELAARILLAAE